MGGNLYVGLNWLLLGVGKYRIESVDMVLPRFEVQLAGFGSF
jgi:hypothetical protein